jgi:hypothetical protein
MIFAFADCTIGIELPSSLQDDPILSNLGNAEVKSEIHTRLVILDEGLGTYQINFGRFAAECGLKRGAVLRRVMQILEESFALITNHTITAGAVAYKNSAAVFIGNGKSSIVAWLIEKGFQYVADDQVSFGLNLIGLCAPIQLDQGAAAHLALLSDFGSAPLVKLAGRFYVSPKAKWLAEENLKTGILVFLNYVPEAEFKIEKIGAVDAALLLKKNQKHCRDYVGLLPLTETTPTIKLTYSSFDQLEDVLDNLLMITLGRKLSPLAFDRFISAMPQFRPAVIAKSTANSLSAWLLLMIMTVSTSASKRSGFSILKLCLMWSSLSLITILLAPAQSNLKNLKAPFQTCAIFQQVIWWVPLLKTGSSPRPTAPMFYAWIAM